MSSGKINQVLQFSNFRDLKHIIFLRKIVYVHIVQAFTINGKLERLHTYVKKPDGIIDTWGENIKTQSSKILKTYLLS